MTTTIKDIAKRLGVSHSTVSRALNGNQLISVAMTRRIVDAAREMGYQPSAAARSLKTNRSQVLGVIVNSLSDPFFSEILFGIEDFVQQQGYSLFVAASQHDPDKERKIVQAMIEHRTDGVIICSSSFGVEQGRQLLAYGFPIVAVNHQSTENFHYSIYHDDHDGSRQVTRHLLDLGHRRIAYLGNSTSGRTNQDRLNGFLQEMNFAHLPVPDALIFQAAGGEPQHGSLCVHQMLATSPLPTALVCFNDMLAIGVIRELTLRGKSIPGDVSVCGFDNIAYSQFSIPALTTLDQPKRSLGTEAAVLLLNLINSADPAVYTSQNTKVLKGKLLIRESTGPCKEKIR